jgi:formylglycine-generating enzyme required for sulfatase activity
MAPMSLRGASIQRSERTLGALAFVLGLCACERSSELPSPEQPPSPVQVVSPAAPAPATTPSGVEPSKAKPAPSTGPNVAPSTGPNVASAGAASVPVPAGSVEIGGKRLTVAAFSMDRTEVATESYAACVSEGRCTPPGTGEKCNWPARKARAEHPINCVTAEQAARYCARHGKRLPTLAEWQLAAGGAEGRRYPWGADHPSNLWVTEPVGDSYPPGPARRKLCWVGDGTAESETYPESTCPAGSHPAGNTPSGIVDLAGNVAEWTSDVERLPEGGAAHRTKGGGYAYDPMGPLPVDVAGSELHPDPHQAPDIGFRCVSAAQRGG